MPHTNELYHRYEDQGLVLIGIHVTSKSFAVDSYPDDYLIDRAGNLRVADLANADLERAIQVLLAEKAPAEKKGKKPRRQL
jgi:hypothetical protein